MTKRDSLETVKDDDGLIYTRERWSDGSICWYNRDNWLIERLRARLLEEKYQIDINMYRET